MGSLDLATFMSEKQIVDNSLGLSKLVNFINARVPQLPTDFGEVDHNTIYLRRAVMSHDWAEQLISDTKTSKYSFTQFITALQGSLQLREERDRARTHDIDYGLYLRNPHDVDHSHNRNRSRPGWPSNNRSKSCSPHRN